MKKVYRIKGKSPTGHSHIDTLSDEFLKVEKEYLKIYNKRSIGSIIHLDWDCKIRECAYSYQDHIWDVAYNLKLGDGLHLYPDYRIIGLHRRFLPLFKIDKEVVVFPVRLRDKGMVYDDYVILNVINNCEHLIDFNMSEVLNRMTGEYVRSFEEYKYLLDNNKMELDYSENLIFTDFVIDDPHSDVFVLHHLFPGRVFITETMKEKIESYHPDESIFINKTNIYIK